MDSESLPPIPRRAQTIRLCIEGLGGGGDKKISMNPTGSLHVLPAHSATRQIAVVAGQLLRLSVKEYATAQQFLDDCQEDQFGCLLVGTQNPGMSGLEILQLLNSRGWQMPVVVVADEADVDLAVRCMKSGAFDFLEQPIPARQLLDSLQQAVQQSAKISLMRKWQFSIASRIAELSARERQVMDLLTTGKHTKEIAADLGLSAKTVEHHRPRILKKMRVNNVVDLVRLTMAAQTDQTLGESIALMDLGESPSLENADSIPRRMDPPDLGTSGPRKPEVSLHGAD